VHIKYTGGIQLSGTLTNNQWYNSPQRLVKRIAKTVHFQCNNHQGKKMTVVVVYGYGKDPHGSFDN